MYSLFVREHKTGTIHKVESDATAKMMIGTDDGHYNIVRVQHSEYYHPYLLLFLNIKDINDVTGLMTANDRQYHLAVGHSCDYIDFTTNHIHENGIVVTLMLPPDKTSHIDLPGLFEIYLSAL